jgi:4-amino-4-deoxy-L-arabinose transferase-like glycosyltransferase
VSPRAPRPDEEATTRGDTDFRRRLALIFLLGLALRVAYVLLVERGDPLSGDGVYYHEAANLLADGLGFTEPYRYLHGGAQELLFVADPSSITATANTALPGGHVEPTAGHPPLWVLVLGFSSMLGFTSVAAHQMLGALVGALGVAAVGWAGRTLDGPRTGLIAAGLAALHACLWLSDGLVMSESLVVTGTALLVGCAVRAQRSADNRWILLLGLVGGLTALVRAEMLLVLPLVAWPVLWTPGVDIRRRLMRYVAVGLVAGAVLAPWTVRNLRAFEEPVLLSNGLGILLAQTNCDATYYGDKQGSWEFQCGLPQPLRSDGTPGDESERDLVYRQRGLEYVADHPGRLVSHVVPKRVGRLWGVYAPIQQLRADILVEGREFRLSVLGLVQFYASVPLAVAGAAWMRRRGQPLLPLLAVPLVGTLVAALTLGATRYRVPTDVVLVLLAAVAVARLRDRRGSLDPGLRLP